MIFLEKKELRIIKMEWKQDLKQEWSNRYVCSLPWAAFELTDNVRIEYVIHESIRPKYASLWKAEIRTISRHEGVRTSHRLKRDISSLEEAKSLCEDNLRDLASSILSKIEGEGWVSATHDYEENCD